MNQSQPTVLRHGDLWIVRVSSAGGPQDFHCASEQQARQLEAVFNKQPRARTYAKPHR